MIKNKKLPGVRVEKPDSIVAVGMDLPLDQVVYNAADNLKRFASERRCA
ncbi:hypothetical protein [Hansschlegelia sp. KR7-227]